MPCDNILNLPEELLLAIINCFKEDIYGVRRWDFEGKDIKVLRATCEVFNHLDAFRLVANNPLLIGGVRQLIIDDTTVPASVTDWASYKNTVTWLAYNRRASYPEGVCERYEGPDRLSGMYKYFPAMTMKHEYWELFNSIAKGRHENRLARADIKALKEALPRFTSLHTLVVSNRTVYDDEILVVENPVTKMWRRVAPYVGGWFWEGKVPLAPRCDWGTYDIETEDEWPEVTGLDWLDDRLFVRVTQLLASVPQLEHLRFEPHTMATVGAPPDMTYPQLRTVNFLCGEVDPEKLINFFRRHGFTLGYVNIQYCNILPSSERKWCDVANQVNREGIVPFADGAMQYVIVKDTIVGCGKMGDILDPTYYDSHRGEMTDVEH